MRRGRLAHLQRFAQPGYEAFKSRVGAEGVQVRIDPHLECRGITLIDGGFEATKRGLLLQAVPIVPDARPPSGFRRLRISPVKPDTSAATRRV